VINIQQLVINIKQPALNINSILNNFFYPIFLFSTESLKIVWYYKWTNYGKMKQINELLNPRDKLNNMHFIVE